MAFVPQRLGAVGGLATSVSIIVLEAHAVAESTMVRIIRATSSTVSMLPASAALGWRPSCWTNASRPLGMSTYTGLGRLDGDASPGQFPGHALRQPQHAHLGGCVGGVLRRPVESSGGGNVHGAAALLPHGGDDGLAAQECAAKVHVKDEVPLFDEDLLDSRVHIADAGSIDEDIDPTERLAETGLATNALNP